MGSRSSDKIGLFLVLGNSPNEVSTCARSPHRKAALGLRAPRAPSAADSRPEIITDAGAAPCPPA